MNKKRHVDIHSLVENGLPFIWLSENNPQETQLSITPYLTIHQPSFVIFYHIRNCLLLHVQNPTFHNLFFFKWIYYIYRWT